MKHLEDVAMESEEQTNEMEQAKDRCRGEQKGFVVTLMNGLIGLLKKIPSLPSVVVNIFKM